jgi:oxygen-independent coproporphyrinogen-3 oxidase
VNTDTLSPASTATVEFDADLIRKLDRPGPRYTSYPTADRFKPDFSDDHLIAAIQQRRALGNRRALSMYVHIPFCESVCYYCACNKVVTRKRERAEEYLGYLLRELEMQGKWFGGAGSSSKQRIEQLHFGGGTPTYFDDEQLGRLMAGIRGQFDFASDAHGEFSIEVDPRTVSPERIRALRALGFNRLSFGVQDFDLKVQEAVHRIQTVEETRDLVRASRDAGFGSVSIDLIYGLPFQNVIGFNKTLNEVIDIRPDRLAIYNYAHLPHLFKPQRRINAEDLPTPDQKLQLLHLCIKRLTDAGYVYIGMDHFALAHDSLARAQQQGRLHRNFQGYSIHADADLVSLGVSSIGAIGASYHQNQKDLPAYYADIDAGKLPVMRGITLNADDLLRRSVIQSLLCHCELSKRDVEEAHSIDFDKYFSRELEELRFFSDEGLVTVDDDWITITRRGRLLARNIAMVFDKYLHTVETTARYSRTV